MTGLSVFVFSLILLLGLLVASVCVLWQPSYQNDKYKPVFNCLTVSATGSASRQSGFIQVVIWNEEPLVSKGVFSPSYSSIDNSLIGFAVPTSGTYFATYNTWCAFQNAVFVQSGLIVNGECVLRSLCPNVCSNNTGTTATVSLNKSFLINLEKGDVVSLIVGASSPVMTIPTSNDSGYATTLTLELRIPKPCEAKDSQVDYSGNTGGYVVGPLMTEDVGVLQAASHLPHPTDQWVYGVFSLEQAANTLQTSALSTKDYQQFASHFNRKENVSLPPTQLF
jgi:hypothetical protein